MKNLTNLNYKIFFFIIISIFNKILSNTSKPMELGKNIIGHLKNDKSREFYELTLKKDKEIEDGSLLVFIVKESRKGIREGEDIFSDPDIYISKTNKFPSNREEADWYSERYGSDIITIPSNAVGKGETFYICMYCQFKCRYELKAYLTKEIPLNLQKVYTFLIQKGNSFIYSLYVPLNEKKEDLNIITQNPSLQNFKIFMSREAPSSQNSFPIIPSWLSGYMITVNKNMKDYCTDCTYHILIQAEEDAEIQLTAYFTSSITEIKSGNPTSDAVKEQNKRCYFFNTKIKKKLQDEKLIIQTTLFSGSVILKIYGWDNSKLSEEIVLDNTSRAKYIYNLESDNSFLLSNEDYSNFDKEYSGNNPDENEKKLYFCIQGRQMSSYLINIYFLSEAENLQIYNYISPGSELTGFLQGGQISSYRILDFSLNKNSDIQLSFTSYHGNTEFYSTFCTKNCKFNHELLEERLNLGEVKKAEAIPISSAQITLKKEENKCYFEKEEKKGFQRKCKTLTIVKCEGTSKDICVFKILLSFNDFPIILLPKKSYYNMITKGKTDLYEINVNEKIANSIVVVLTTITGDAELTVLKKIKNDAIGTPSSEIVVGISKKKDYIPDVIRITPSKINAKDVTGRYIVKVTSVSFSSYNLYYYTTRIKMKEEQPNIKDVSSFLFEGRIISDYFPNDLPFKIYSYSPSDKSKANQKDIKIVLTRINVNFSFKVYLNFNKIKYNYNAKSKYEERLSNYLWASDSNNEVTITTDDPNYSRKGPYYIVVTKDKTEMNNDNDNELEYNSLLMYYLGVTRKGASVMLTEGIDHSETLTEKYNYQKYLYIHEDFNKPFQLEINVLSGQVDVFVDIIYLSEEKITQYYLKRDNITEIEKKENTTYYVMALNDYTTIKLDNFYFEKNKDLLNKIFNHSCVIYIYITQSISNKKFQKDSQYLITAKSSLTKGKILISGKVYESEIKDNSPHYYVIQEVKHRKGSVVNLLLKQGYADLYVSIPENQENTDFPDEKKHDYKGESCYRGKIVKIPVKVFERINSKSLKLKILVSIIPITVENQEINEVKYSISYSSEPKRINQNIPYQSSLSEGDSHYFTFYFGKNTENIYISLSNMNGDADMFLNYGKDILPSSSKYDWSSTNLGHEYIDINKNDNYFKKNDMEDISGYYTLLILGITKTTYTLFVSTHSDNILTLTNSMPVYCRCNRKDDKCYFRFNDIYYDETINKTEIFITTKYNYGNGVIYAKILKDQEISNDNNKKYQEFFPTAENFDFSNSEIGKRHYLKIVVEDNNYSKDSLVLLTFVCGERTDAEITATSPIIEPLFSYIDSDKENIFYLKTNTTLKPKDQLESTFIYYMNKEEDLIYKFHAYSGMAKVRVYTNDSYWNESLQNYIYQYDHIAEFNIKADSITDNDKFRFFNAHKEKYFNTISKSIIYQKNVYFSVKPLIDFGFYIQILNDRSWINIPIGISKSYLINKNLMYGYFEIDKDFTNVEFSLTLDESQMKYITVYAKMTIINKNSGDNIPNDQNYNEIIPNELNNDYQGKTNDILGVLNINFDNLPIIKDEEIGYKFIRVYLSIHVNKKEKNDVLKNKEIIIKPETTIKITVTPSVNNFKRVDLSQHTYYFSKSKLIPNSNLDLGSEGRNYDGNKEIKIYTLDRKSADEQKMLIDISVCEGDFEFKFGNKITNYDDNSNNIIVKQVGSKYGVTRFLIDNLHKLIEKNKNFYLSIKPKNNTEDCLKKNKCYSELSYLIYYYTMTNKEYNSNNPYYHLNYNLGKNKELLIKIPQLKGTDFKNNFRDQKDIEYTLFYTNQEKYCDYLKSICHLSQVLNDVLLNGKQIWEKGNITVIKDVHVDNALEYTINGIDPKEKLCINVLARNLKTNEFTAYFPIYNVSTKSGIKSIFIFIFVFGLLAFGIYLGINYYKTRKKEDESDYPKITEMGAIGSAKGGYSSISLDNF